MSLQFYMDVHVPRAITAGLRMRGIHVLTSREDGTTEVDDDLLLLRATELGCILVTQDTDLLREGSKLLMQGTPFADIVYAHQLRTNIGEMVDDLELIARTMSSEEWIGKIEYLPPPVRNPISADTSSPHPQTGTAAHPAPH